jgi:DNA-binding transcriptional ArsR family regulator
MRLRLSADPTRIRLMWLLEEHGPASVATLASGVETTAGNVSRHLGVLHQAGIVSRTREGRSVHYELIDWTALWLVEQMASSVAAQLEAQQERFARP